MELITERIRAARVGDLLRNVGAERAGARRLEATALVIPGAAGLGAHVASLESRRVDFADWDGRVVVVAGDGNSQHHLAIVDRYGQVYEAFSARDAGSLPDAAALEEWFKFLATACPECGVIDDPRERDWVP